MYSHMTTTEYHRIRSETLSHIFISVLKHFEKRGTGTAVALIKNTILQISHNILSLNIYTVCGRNMS